MIVGRVLCFFFFFLFLNLLIIVQQVSYLLRRTRERVLCLLYELILLSFHTSY